MQLLFHLEGVHVIESSFFKYEGLVATNDMHIVHGGTGTALHVIRVPEASQHAPMHLCQSDIDEIFLIREQELLRRLRGTC